jgi:hypothetical protein
MTTSDRGRRAAQNNAFWCDAVCRAHGGQTQTTAQAWLNRRPSPPFYPNLITLEPTPEVAAWAPLLHALTEDAGLAAFGVKDSFARLDLGGHGFEPLFEARWIWIAPERVRPCTGGLRWSAVRTADELTAWEDAWWAAGESVAPDPDDEVPPRPRLFLPALLQHAGVQFLGGWREGRLAAGIALAASHGVVSLYCRLTAPDAPADTDAQLVAEVARRHAGVPLVGYESGESLERLCAEGFEDIGPLRVWVRGAA